MATRTVANLTAIISANNTKFKSGLKDSQKALGGFQKSLGQLKGMIAGTFAVGALISFGREAIRLSSELELSLIHI